MAARYFIGIDLGTSNCALSFVDAKDPQSGTQIFKIPQFESLDTLREHTTLPSFCYYLSDAENEALKSDDKEAWSQESIVGIFARNQAALQADRTITSAKSWLCHSGIDRQSKVLPWQSQSIEPSQRRSPVEASAAYLDYLRFAWNQTIGARDKQSNFDRQDIVITVPASFDTVAQRLTLDAAEKANYPNNTRILEEPQAAFYAWLEKHPDLEQWTSLIHGISDAPKIALVCDIGGGTSDFSLFELSVPASGSIPFVRRLAVSNHILLGGDNIDLALAHLAETKLDSQKTLSSSTWSQLVAQCRDLKEKALSTEGPNEETFTIALAGQGSSLFTSTITVSLTRNEIANIALDGFFPICGNKEKPDTKVTGLREIGLPYAQDSAITRHLADFLRQRKIDAILFNGGTLATPKLQNRITEIITDWQDGYTPSVLQNTELDLAVARGAAWQQAALQRENAATIEAGSGHSFYLEVAYAPKKKRKKGAYTSSNDSRLVCILPQGSPIEESTHLVDLDLSLKVNTPVQFQAYTSTCREDDSIGNMIPNNEHDFHKLPSMHTMAQLPPGEELPENGSVPIQIETRLNSLGILRVTCVSVRRIQGQNRKWQLEFNLRGAESPQDENPEKAAEASNEHGISSESMSSAHDAIKQVFDRKTTNASQATSLLKNLEKATHLPRKEWSTSLIRSFWDEHAQFLTARDISPDHELSWLNAAGFFLRPGYGHPLDEYKLKTLWFIEELDLVHPKQKAIREQYFLLWRRVAGGLNKIQQSGLFEKWIDKVLADTKQSYEPARMLGAFERLSPERRSQLAKHFVKSIGNRKDSYCDHSIWALGRLLNRVPLYGGEQAILPTTEVEQAFNELAQLDWTQDNLRNLPQLFVQAGRIINQRDHDLTAPVRELIISKILQSKAKLGMETPLKEYIPIGEKDIQQLYGEALPTGLLIS